MLLAQGREQAEEGAAAQAADHVAHEQDEGGVVGYGAYTRAWRRATNPGRPELR